MCWSNFFKSQDISPLEIMYEDMIEQPSETIRQISEHFDLEVDHKEVIPRSKRMADAYTQIIYDRFVSDLTAELGIDIANEIIGSKELQTAKPTKAVQLSSVRKKHVFVTLATSDYLAMSKQLFASAYYNAGWDGDYLRLAYEIPDEELDWFRNRGIIIRHCSPIHEGQPGGMHACLSSKFYMFTPYFKQWDTVIYSDVDAIVRAPLDELKSVKGFNAVEDWSPSLSEQIVSDKDIMERRLDGELCNNKINKLAQDYKISRRPFCAGFFAFSTDIISEGIFEDLKETMDNYHLVSRYGDQLSMNLYFYSKWNRLHPTFNLLIRQDPGKTPFFRPFRATTRWGLFKNMDGYVLHIFNPKPWDPISTFYLEWLANLKRAENLNVSRIPVADLARVNGISRTKNRMIPRQILFEVAEYFGNHKMKVIRLFESVYWQSQILKRLPALLPFAVNVGKDKVNNLKLRVRSSALATRRSKGKQIK
jgi:lipopolysaccharide biosynthesis glycosyltransferase